MTYADSDTGDVAVTVNSDGDPGVLFVSVEVTVELFIMDHQDVVVLQELFLGERDVVVGVEHAEPN